MITVQLGGRGQEWRLDTPRADMIGPWLMAMFSEIKPSPYGDTFTITISGSEIPRSGRKN